MTVPTNLLAGYNSNEVGPRIRRAGRRIVLACVVTLSGFSGEQGSWYTTEAFVPSRKKNAFSVWSGHDTDAFGSLKSMSTKATYTASQTALFSSAVSRKARSGETSNVQSSIVSHLAECALKLRLKSNEDVKAIVSSNVSADLFQGCLSVGPVTVKGKGWQSELGLTCRSIEATVKTCKLDLGRFIRDQKLRLTVPAVGDAMVALNGVDFGSFITHPLVQPLVIGGEDFTFMREGAQIDAQKQLTMFNGTFRGCTWQCKLYRKKAGGGAVVEVIHESDASDEVSTAKLLAVELTSYFNNVVLELDGIYLSFRDMMVVTRTSGEYLLLSLNIEVHKFPSPGVAF